MKIGVIGVQGAVEEHITMTNKALAELGIEGKALWLRFPEEVDAFIVPGGESTTITDLMKSTGLWALVKASGKPVMGTCAGLIVLSKQGVGDTEKTGQELMGLLNCKVNRNAFGRQKESFEAEVDVFDTKIKGVFIRAPAVEEIFENCKVVCRFEDKIVGVEQGNVLGLSFHPELTEKSAIHKYFIQKVQAFLKSQKS